ncbi:hypothetical protein [Mycolicibacterium sp. GF69]|uniref:hypothetical protein n=1 Tax=Mycolicibacterium sp. GF69 TaxID=2267251 RepID=UPI001057C522|nr:hypothetical protein [Mycolicibacterium sp. GF69]
MTDGAIGLTWRVPKNRRMQFNRDVDQELIPSLVALHTSRKIVGLLPFRHKPLRTESVESFWTDYWVIVLAFDTDPDIVWQSIRSSAVPRTLLRAEVLLIQPGMDMYYPRGGGAKSSPVWHIMEYVVSRFETRAEYYREQYEFSRPVITHFWKNDSVERMIGFERERLLQDDGFLPGWDIIHITGFKPSRLGRVAWHLLRSLATFNGYAERIGYRSAMEVLRSWDKKRRKYLVIARQDYAHTLPLF